MTKKTDKSILVISDMHVGASTAVCSESPIIADTGSRHVPNGMQEKLYEDWKSCIKSLKNKKPDLLVINGEPCDGSNQRQEGNQSWSTNIHDQLIDAEKLIRMIQYKKIAFVRGSGYHVTKGGTNFEEILAAKMNATPCKPYDNNGLTDNFANFKINGKTVNFAHHIPFSKIPGNRTGALSREMKQLVAEKDKHGKIDLIVRSHVHYYVEARYPDIMGVITPCWKYPDGFLFRSGMAGTVPDVGMVEILINGKGKIEIIPHLREMPKLANSTYI